MPLQPKVFESTIELATAFAQDFSKWVQQTSGDFHVALSGGSTPQVLFEHWASKSAPTTAWDSVHFFWGDERCVPPDDQESNFGVADRLFFRPAGIDEKQVHRIAGEADPAAEAQRYSKLLQDRLTSDSGFPQFDLVILGMGTDGHTASIFPDQFQLLDDDRICAVAMHPESKQQRITLTGPTITVAKRIAFLITGQSKAEKVRGIIDRTTESESWPASRFFYLNATSIYLDRAAAGDE